MKTRELKELEKIISRMPAAAQVLVYKAMSCDAKRADYLDLATEVIYANRGTDADNLAVGKKQLRRAISPRIELVLSSYRCGTEKQFINQMHGEKK